jgi:NADH-quinone oxidoreductase subunit L
MEYILVYICTIFLLPLLSFLLQLIAPRSLSSAMAYLSTALLCLSSILSSICLYAFYNDSSWTFADWGIYSALKLIEIPWVTLPDFHIGFGMNFDKLAVVMLLVVSLISFLVHLYSIDYMRGDKRFSRYFAYLGLFTFSMNGIVLSNNLFFTFIFWELVGFSSFLLIGFWYEKKSAGNAANKAFLVNRVGDIGMFLGIMLLFMSTGTFSFNGIQYADIDNGIMTIAGLLIFMGAVGKSAQVPLHIWLPDAMEGPTPVSALIHAATMVAAGVYLSLRIFPFLTLEALHVIALIGATTAIVASFIATSQYDIKKILAYSTVSQLGYMVCSIGVGAYFAAFFHLITHAMFKACLFLCSGSVIQAMHHSQEKLHDHSKDPQDIRNMGGLRSKMPITFFAMLISTLSLCGVPLFSGFLSKDSIVAGAISYYNSFHGLTFIIPLFIILSAALTAFYMFRLIFLVFFGESREISIYSHIKESSYYITAPLILLSLLSFAFIFTFPSFNPLDSHGWFYSMLSTVTPFQTLGYDMYKVESGIHHAHTSAMIISITVAFIGFLLAYFKYYLKRDILSLSTNGIYIKSKNLFRNKFYIDEAYEYFIISPFLRLSKIASIIDWNYYDQRFIDSWGWITIKLSKISSALDYHLLDQFIVDGLARLANRSGKELQSSQNGVLQSYLFSGVLGLIILLIIIQQLG